MLKNIFITLEINVFISDEFEKPMISSALSSQFHYKLGQEIELWGFSNKKLFGKSYPSTFKMTFDSVRYDSVHAIYLPTEEAKIFKSLSLQEITGIWLKDPFSAQQAQKSLQSIYPQSMFYSWIDQYSSLFDAIAAEKRLVGIVLSLLIILIFILFLFIWQNLESKKAPTFILTI